MYEPILVTCTGCGRGYAPDRFPYGRVLHCTCGARVGRSLGSGVRERTGDPRFFADVMLGKLARWLRVLGYDTHWEPEIADDELVRQGVEERRWVLAQDRRLLRDWWVDNLLLIESDMPLEQLREVAARVPLSADQVFSRCLECNTPVKSVAPGEVAARLPPDILAAEAEVRRCLGCGRVYWEGSHTRRMREQLRGVFD